MTKPIVLLDLDDTILDFHKAEAIAISKTFTKLGIEPTEELIAHYSTINAAQWKRLEKGEINREQVQVGRFEILFGELDIERSSHEAKSIYENFLSQGHYFIPGAEQLLEELQGDYRLFICSNGNAVVQEGRLNSSGIKPYFEDIFISEDIGFDKPSTEYFRRCFEKIHDFDRARAIIIGDSLSSDIQGGINAGIKTCWFNPKGKAGSETVIPDFEIRKLDQVNRVLEQAFV
jgi:2-haloacid dehalogenase